MKLLFVTKDWSQGIEKNTVYLSHALSRLTDFLEWHEPGDINDIVKRLPKKPDFILLNDLRPTRCPEITGIDRLKIPLGIIMHDLNYKPEKRKAFIRNNNIRYLFVHYREYFLKEYSEFSDRMIWFPHWVNTDIFNDYRQPKSYEYLLMGCIEPSIYALRSRILNTMQNEQGFVYHPHPGYDQTAYTEDKYIIGRRYAMEINKAKMLLTDGSKYKYVVMKYFEVPACKTLLLAPHTQDAADLGFVPDVNYIDINELNFLDKARYYASNYNTVGKQIALRGYEMVRSAHTVSHRARQLVRETKKILGD